MHSAFGSSCRSFRTRIFDGRSPLAMSSSASSELGRERRAVVAAGADTDVAALHAEHRELAIQRALSWMRVRRHGSLQRQQMGPKLRARSRHHVELELPQRVQGLPRLHRFILLDELIRASCQRHA
ncbi:hypothetical protein BE15_31950 [Sorangium cellulosum]|uniref:Uncharacterized protein n=1 Tax=Sorangium cellulosum TaxID=56 RepID=A0A150QQH4_SORCE|nr:hypothetical protein BE15_31950 [Sorangium cellulosum]